MQKTTTIQQIHWVSKKYKSSKLTKKTVEIHDFIDVFEDKVNGWYLNWAYSLDKNRHSGFAELQLALPYFEAIYIFKEGEDPDRRGKSGEIFKNGFKQVFKNELAHIPSGELEDFLKLLYEEARCGFFHIGMSRPMIALADGTHAVRTEVDADGKIIKLKIDRHLFWSK